MGKAVNDSHRSPGTRRGQGDILSQHLVGQCGPQGRAWAGLYSDRQSKTVVSDSSLEIREVVATFDQAPIRITPRH